ncbi:pyridoxamine 5'-phosphate oxidase family protein [Streptomyces longisporoflavus]|uniref:Pyridoxamine 5'-phosphate oxidase family protein n=1 Tax=Streptomyces longisporoflavus TaxID=28044 RepID=A0ABW7R250_9ACTN
MSDVLGDRVRELDRHESLRLLARASVGRIVHTRDALPAVCLVHFSLDGDTTVLVRVAADSELTRALDGAVVAFEADEIDEIDTAACSGWSVVVIGRSTVANDPAVHERLSRSGPDARAGSPTDVLVRVEAELVTGREFFRSAPLHVGRDI